MNEDTWGNLHTWERRDHKLIREYLNDATEEFEKESWKLEWINLLKWWPSENQTEKTHELLRMGEKNSHNWKQLREDGMMNNSGRKELNHSRGNKNKIYCMFILHQLKLMTSNGFGKLLIPVERIKRDIAQTWEGIDGTTGGIWKKRISWYDNEGSEILNEPP